MTGRVRELVQQDEGSLCAADDQARVVGTRERGAEEAALCRVRASDVLEAPRRPQRLRHGAHVCTRRAEGYSLSVPRGPSLLLLALAAAGLLATVAGAGGQQTATCLEERPTISGTPGNDVLTGTPGSDG